MKSINFNLLIILGLLSVSLSSCSIVGDIFQAGMSVGIFLVLLVIALIIWIFTRVGKR